MLLLKSLLQLGTLISAARTLDLRPLNNSFTIPNFQNTLFVKLFFIMITSPTEIGILLCGTLRFTA